MKQVGFNALLLHPRAGGIAIYMENLVDALLNVNAEWMPRIFLRSQAVKHYGYRDADTLVPIALSDKSPLQRIIFEWRTWPQLLSKYRIDLFHVPISYFIPGIDLPTIVTVHDLRRFHFPETYTRLRGLFLDKMIPRSIEQAVKIIAVSEFTKKDILNLFGISAEKVDVIHSGIDSHRFSTPASSTRKEYVRRQYALPESYILAVGHLEPRKNYMNLIEAYAAMRAQKRMSHHLVIVGQENWHYQNLYRRIKQLHLVSHVHFLGYVEFSDLPAIYQMASLFVAPSIFEGFSFTPLEAMAAGIPVAVSNAASHPEVCGDAAAYFDPDDVENMTDTMSRLLDDHQYRQRLRQNSEKNIQRFTWSKCIDETFRIYEVLLNSL